MRQFFPQKKPGDTLSADHVERLSRVARAVSADSPGGHSYGFRGSFTSTSSDQAHIETLVRIIGPEEEDKEAKIYKFQRRWFHRKEDKWFTAELERRLDIRGYTTETGLLQRGAVLIHGDRVNIRYDEQRGLYVPVTPMCFARWAFTPEEGIPRRKEEPGNGIPDVTEYSEICKVVKQELSTDGTEITWSQMKDDDDEGVEVRVFNGLDVDIPGRVLIRIFYNSIGQFQVLEAPGLCEFCLQEDHPGRGIVFEVKLGKWDVSSHAWCFEGDNEKAIDWRYDVPYPGAGSRGQGYFMPSEEHGRILIPIDMDCSSPGACPGCGGS